MSNSQVSRTVIDCEPIVDIKIAAELYAHLKNAVQNKHAIEINANDVQRVDAAVLQVFLGFMLEARAQELPVTWQGVSDAFRASANLLGISDALSLPAAA